MTPNRVKLPSRHERLMYVQFTSCIYWVGRAIAFVKQLASIVFLIFLPTTLVWNKVALLALNLLNFPELVVNQL